MRAVSPVFVQPRWQMDIGKEAPMRRCIWWSGWRQCPALGRDLIATCLAAGQQHAKDVALVAGKDVVELHPRTRRFGTAEFREAAIEVTSDERHFGSNTH